MMKKKIITIAAIASIALLTAAYSIFSTEKNQVNSLLLENIEALASSEKGPNDPFWCETCGPCTGSYYYCKSVYDQVWNDISNNCGPGTDFTIEWIEGC